MSLAVVPPDERDAPLPLTGGDLTVPDVVQVARGGRKVHVGEETLARVREVRDAVDRVLESGTPTYGLNTGLGALARHRLSAEELDRFSFATVADETASYGPVLERDIVRAMMLTRANSMAKAGVGVRKELLLSLVALLNQGVTPRVREFGSVGQADIYEMAEIGKVLIGRGRAEYRGDWMPGIAALAAAGLQPVRLAPKEALAIISANGLTTGRGSLALHDIGDLFDSMHAAAALSLEGFGANLSSLHPAVSELRPHPGQGIVAEALRRLLAGSHLWRQPPRNLQDPLSFRCLPQTNGAVFGVLEQALQTMEIELNSSSDNPIVVVEEDIIVSNGNFDVTGLALAFDALRIGLAGIARMVSERVQKLLWSSFSDLHTYLAAQEGGFGGLRASGRRCAALAGEARFLANPVSPDYSGQLAEGIEDHGSMAPLAVRRTGELVSLCHKLVAEELMVAAEAVDSREVGARLGAGSGAAYRAVREYVPRLDDITEWRPDVSGLVDLVASGGLGVRVRAALADPRA